MFNLGQSGAVMVALWYSDETPADYDLEECHSTSCVAHCVTRYDYLPVFERNETKKKSGAAAVAPTRRATTPPVSRPGSFSYSQLARSSAPHTTSLAFQMLSLCHAEEDRLEGGRAVGLCRLAPGHRLPAPERLADVAWEPASHHKPSAVLRQPRRDCPSGHVPFGQCVNALRGPALGVTSPAEAGLRVYTSARALPRTRE